MKLKIPSLTGRIPRGPPMLTFLTTLCLILAVTGTAGAITYGLKSLAPTSGPTVSAPPTHLFQFAEDGSWFTDIGAIKLTGADIDADGLAASPNHGLLAFQIADSGSTLIALDNKTGVATAVGSELSGRDIRGATFDLADALWAIDATSDDLLRIDPTTGIILGSPVALTLGGSAFDLSTASDVAVRRDGTFYLVSCPGIYTLDAQTGALTNIKVDSGQGLSGAAFSLAAGNDALLAAYEINGPDDVFVYDVDAAGIPRTVLYPNIIPSFNAGRGDLAAVIIPEPVTMAGLMLGIGCLARYVRKRRGA